MLEPPYLPYIQNVAVVIFFLLSGFVITYTLLRKNSDPIYGMREYMIDRSSRIFSAYFPALFLIIAFDSLQIYLNGSGYTHWDSFNLRTFVVNLFMLQDFPFLGLGTSFGSARPFWTLAIEWWIYVSFGYFILVIYKNMRTGKKIRMYHGLIFIAVSIVPVYNLIGGRGNGLTMVWLIGMILVLILLKIKLPPLNTLPLIVLSAVFLVLAFIRGYIIKEAYDLLFAGLLAFSLFFLLYALQKVESNRDTLLRKWITMMSRYSFTLYLIHYSVLEILILYKSHMSPYLLLVVSFLVCNLLAFVIAYFTEMRYRTLAKMIKRKWLQSGSGSSYPLNQ